MRRPADDEEAHAGRADVRRPVAGLAELRVVRGLVHDLERGLRPPRGGRGVHGHARLVAAVQGAVEEHALEVARRQPQQPRGLEAADLAAAERAAEPRREVPELLLVDEALLEDADGVEHAVARREAHHGLDEAAGPHRVVRGVA